MGGKEEVPAERESEEQAERAEGVKVGQDSAEGWVAAAQAAEVSVAADWARVTAAEVRAAAARGWAGSGSAAGSAAAAEAAAAERVAWEGRAVEGWERRCSQPPSIRWCRCMRRKRHRQDLWRSLQPRRTGCFR